MLFVYLPILNAVKKLIFKTVCRRFVAMNIIFPFPILNRFPRDHESKGIDKSLLLIIAEPISSNDDICVKRFAEVKLIKMSHLFETTLI